MQMHLKPLLSLLVLDDGYHVPSRYTDRVLTGTGPGPDLVTHMKPLPVSTHDPHIQGGFA